MNSIVFDRFANAMVSRNWIVDRIARVDKIALPTVLSRRYKQIPNEFIKFLTEFRSIRNAQLTSQFLCIDDYSGKSGIIWNQWELESLEAVRDDDVMWRKEIEEFWNRTLPVVVGVEKGYSYLGISFSRNGSTCLVKGREPMYEEARVVCNSFAHLIELLCEEELPKFFFDFI